MTWLPPRDPPLVGGAWLRWGKRAALAGRRRRCIACSRRPDGLPVHWRGLSHPGQWLPDGVVHRALTEFGARRAGRRRLRQVLDLVVGDTTLDRALRVMDALLKALEERVHRVEVREVKPPHAEPSHYGKSPVGGTDLG